MLTTQQIEERKLGLGGSDMPIIFGLSSYKTPYVLYLEKRGIITSDQEITPQQYWGNAHEDTIRKHFVEQNKVAVEQPTTIIHPKYNFLRANVDGYIPEWNAVLEIKCSSPWMAHEWGESGSDIIPMQYLLQVAHYCMCLNADKAIISVLIGLYDYREYTYNRDPELEGMIILQSKKFWDGVLSGVEPDLMTIKDANIKYASTDPDKCIRVSDELSPLAYEMSNLREKMKGMQKESDDIKLKLMEYMQDAECLVDENDKPMATWKSTKRGRTFLLKGLDNE